MSESLREKLAANAHDSWTSWMTYMFGCGMVDAQGQLVIPASLVERWQRQMVTPYGQLPEQEKRSDRIEADRILFALTNDAILKGK